MDIGDRDCVKQLADVTMVQQQLRTGHRPKHVDIAVAGDALILVLHDALTTAEKNISTQRSAANQLRTFHRELFLSSSNTMKNEIARITGRSVQETGSEIVTSPESLVYAPMTGVIIQVFMLNPEIKRDETTPAEQVDSGVTKKTASSR